MKLYKTLALILITFPLLAAASEKQVLKLQQVSSNTWAIVGPLDNRSEDNLGNNATFGFVVTSEGVVLIDSGGSAKGAKAIHQLILTVTKQPIRYVINTGGQDHRWFGNDYFSRQGAKIISSAVARRDQQARVNQQWTMMETLIGKAAIAGTREKYADITFDDQYAFTLGGIRFEIYHHGQAHTPGDAYVWLPQQKIVFSGDIVFTERMLGILEDSNSKSWLESFNAMAGLQPQHIIPGHGSPTSLEKARADTGDYLEFLRQAVATFMENGGDASAIGTIDQSRFSYLHNYDTLKGRNALKVYIELEWE
jgi:glyoxylase-like metal-dependent hydrolase (beta-lactamase superfamily II)